MNEFDKIWNETMGCGACDVKPSEDCISRAATIQIIENKLNPCTDMFKCLEMSEIKEDVEHLPSVTPTNEDIKEAYLKGYDYGVKDWFKSKTQPCEDAVSREEVQDLISIWLSDYLLDETREALETINYKVGDMPSVYPERPKGKWIHKMQIMSNPYTQQCSVCKEWQKDKSKYCPNCGAEMIGGGEDEISD